MASESVGISTYKWHFVIRLYHVYKEVWTPVQDNELAVKKEENGYDCFAIECLSWS